MNNKEAVYHVLDELRIRYEVYNHPPAPTIEIAQKHWRFIDATHCKNIFFRNHKGNKHYLVILEANQKLNIRELELKLKQGKLTFASEKRLTKYLNVEQGSVTPFGLINDKENHVYVFIDQTLEKAEKLSFHPNINTSSLVIDLKSFITFMDWTRNKYEFINMY
jgi:Ala-tRNA(Pro) deacylase